MLPGCVVWSSNGVLLSRVPASARQLFMLAMFSTCVKKSQPSGHCLLFVISVRAKQSCVSSSDTRRPPVCVVKCGWCHWLRAVLRLTSSIGCGQRLPNPWSVSWTPMVGLGFRLLLFFLQRVSLSHICGSPRVSLCPLLCVSACVRLAVVCDARRCSSNQVRRFQGRG